MKSAVVRWMGGIRWLLLALALTVPAAAALAPQTEGKDGTQTTFGASYDAQGNLVWTMTQEHYEKGQLVWKKEYDKNGKVRRLTTYSYLNGFKEPNTATTTYGPDGTTPQSTVTTDHDKDGNVTSTVTIDYDEKGNESGRRKVTTDPATGKTRCYKWNSKTEQYDEEACPKAAAAALWSPHKEEDNRLIKQIEEEMLKRQREKQQPEVPISGPASSTLVGVVIASEAQPGDPVLVTIAMDPEQYENTPGLRVARMEVPLRKGPDGQATLSGLVVNTGDGKLQSAAGPILLNAAQQMTLTFTQGGDPASAVSRQLTIPAGTPAPLRTPASAGFKAPPVCFGLEAIHGPFQPGPNSLVLVGNKPAKVVTKTPRVAFVQIPPGTPAGPTRMIVADGTQAAAFPLFILHLIMRATLPTLKTGQATDFEVTLTGVENMPEALWQAPNASDVVDFAGMQRLAPGLQRPKQGDPAVIALFVQNASRSVVTIEGSKDKSLSWTLQRDAFAKGAFHYKGVLRGRRGGRYLVHGIAIPWFWELPGYQLQIPRELAETRP